MGDLAATVTSSLLPFSEVTVDGFSNAEPPHGKITTGRSGLAWVACGSQLEVVQLMTAKRLSAYYFCVPYRPPLDILAVHEFCWLKRTGLLVGLRDTAGSRLCLYDLGISSVVKCVVIPDTITVIEPIVSYGGASVGTQHLHRDLRWFFGVAAVVTDSGRVLLVDLRLDDLSCPAEQSDWEVSAADLEVVTAHSDLAKQRETATQLGRHLCMQLSSPMGVEASAVQYIARTNQLAVGFMDGHLQLWNMKSLKNEYNCQLEGGHARVSAFTFQEPENDPRNCCYLWAVQSSHDLEGEEGNEVSIHLLQLAFRERKSLASGNTLYEGLEYVEERYCEILNGTAASLRGRATNTCLLSCQTIEKFRHHTDRDDGINEAASPDTSLSIFSWQVKSCGQAKPSTYLGVFDINRWYHAQLPFSLRTGESLHSCPYFAVWSLDMLVEKSSPGPLLDILVHERSLSRGVPFTFPPPDEFFSPTAYNFDATCLFASGIVHLTCSGHQKETLSYLRKAMPVLNENISKGFTRCLRAGLLAPHLADIQSPCLTQEDQMDAVLSTAVETSSLGVITGCIKQWNTEEQPGCPANLRYVLDWAWGKVVHIKEELDGTCMPLFDNSSNFTEPHTLELLQRSHRLLCNLSTIFWCLLSHTQSKEITQKGLDSLVNKILVSSLIAQYAQVVLWFCRTGLLPECSAEEDVLQMSRPSFSYSIIRSYYVTRREELQVMAGAKWNGDCLMIDALVCHCGELLADIWRRDEGWMGKYPPRSLHALLDIYLLEDIEVSTKHAIIIYLLLDIMYSLPNKNVSSVEYFPTAFALPIGLVKLVQGFWLIDHCDYEMALEVLLNPATSHSIWTWQHSRVLEALMGQNRPSLALRYLQIMKPLLKTTAEIKLGLSVLLCNRCIVEAWALLRQHSGRLNMKDLLSFFFQTCSELHLMSDLLKLPLSLKEQECLESYLKDSGGYPNDELLMVHYLQQANYVSAFQLNKTLNMNKLIGCNNNLKRRFKARNAMLEQYGKVLPIAQWLASGKVRSHTHPATIFKRVSRPQPLSTVARRSLDISVTTRATFISTTLSKIEEVWSDNNRCSSEATVKSPCLSGVPEIIPEISPAKTDHAFIATPFKVTRRRMPSSSDMFMDQALLNMESKSVLQITSSCTPKRFNRTSELKLLQTPPVIKKIVPATASILTATEDFSIVHPQSILRSSLRPTPLATPSVSPGRSATPPLHSKDIRITFVENQENYCTPKVPVDQLPWRNELRGDATNLSQSIDGQDELQKDEEKVNTLRLPKASISSVSFDESPTPLVPEPNLSPVMAIKPCPAPILCEEDVIEEVVVRREMIKQAVYPIREVKDSLPMTSSGSDMEENYNIPSTKNESKPQKTEQEGQICECQDDTPFEINVEVESLEIPDVSEDEVAKTDKSVEPKESQPPFELVSKDEQAPPQPPHESEKPFGMSQFSPSMLSNETAVPSQTSELEPVPGIQVDYSGSEEIPHTERMEQDNTRENQEATEVDLTAFVDQYLFECDASNVDWSEANSWNASVGSGKQKPPTSSTAGELLVLTSQKSVAVLEPTTSHSPSVETVHDSDHGSSSSLESKNSDQEVEEENKDSESEVEIIEEVQGNQHFHPLAASVFLQQLSNQSQYLQEKSTQEHDLILREEEEVVIVRTADQRDTEDENVSSSMCFTELKPSATILVPLEIEEVEFRSPQLDVKSQGQLDDNAPMSLATPEVSKYSLALMPQDTQREDPVKCSEEKPDEIQVEPFCEASEAVLTSSQVQIQDLSMVSTITHQDEDCIVIPKEDQMVISDLPIVTDTRETIGQRETDYSQVLLPESSVVRDDVCEEIAPSFLPTAYETVDTTIFEAEKENMDADNVSTEAHSCNVTIQERADEGSPLVSALSNVHQSLEEATSTPNTEEVMTSDISFLKEIERTVSQLGPVKETQNLDLIQGDEAFQEVKQPTTKTRSSTASQAPVGPTEVKRKSLRLSARSLRRATRASSNKDSLTRDVIQESPSLHHSGSDAVAEMVNSLTESHTNSKDTAVTRSSTRAKRIPNVQTHSKWSREKTQETEKGTEEMNLEPCTNECTILKLSAAEKHVEKATPKRRGRTTVSFINNVQDTEENPVLTSVRRSRRTQNLTRSLDVSEASYRASEVNLVRDSVRSAIRSTNSTTRVSHNTSLSLDGLKKSPSQDQVRDHTTADPSKSITEKHADYTNISSVTTRSSRGREGMEILAPLRLSRKRTRQIELPVATTEITFFSDQDPGNTSSSTNVSSGSTMMTRRQRKTVSFQVAADNAENKPSTSTGLHDDRKIQDATMLLKAMSDEEPQEAPTSSSSTRIKKTKVDNESASSWTTIKEINAENEFDPSMQTGTRTARVTRARHRREVAEFQSGQTTKMVKAEQDAIQQGTTRRTRQSSKAVAVGEPILLSPPARREAADTEASKAMLQKRRVASKLPLQRLPKTKRKIF